LIATLADWPPPGSRHARSYRQAAARRDWEQWLALWRSYHVFYRNDPSDEVTRTTWARFFDESEPVHARVAEREGRLIGTVHYLYHCSTWMIAPVYYSRTFSRCPRRAAGASGAL
jgi:hypothetical protein